MSEAEGAARFTRRHWGRELLGVYRDLTGPFRGASGKYSMFRIILAAFAIQFVRNWPRAWFGDAAIVLALILFALPIDVLFARVPVAESLAALTAFFQSVMGRVSVPALPGTTVTKTSEATATETVTATPAPLGVASDQRAEES